MSKNTGGYFYDGPKINRLFGLSALALLGSTLWMVWQDYAREWKGYQQAARELEIQRVQKEKAFREAQIEPKALQQARQDLDAAAKDVESRRADLGRLEKDVQARNAAYYKADQEFRAGKAEVDAARYRAEEARHHEGDVAKAEREYQDWLARLDKLKLNQEQTLAALSDARGEIAQMTRARDDAAQKQAKLTAQVTRLDKRLARIGHDLANDYFFDQPGVDYMAPNLKVKQVMPPDLRDDYNFVRVQKVDRCITCHVNIDKPGFEGQQEPFNSHPRLDLYLNGRSAHPLESFGCTICHGGQGSATDFLHAYHTPRDAAQAEAWQKTYGWLDFQEEHAGLWNFPMLPQAHETASCRKCHMGRVDVDGAEAYDRGKFVFERAGCWGCHKAAGFEPKLDPKEGRVPTAAEQDKMPKVGPDLTHLGEKMTPEFVAKWISDPKNFRAHTRMPTFFGVAPDMTPEMRQRESDEIQAITAYLFHAAQSRNDTPPPQGGDAGRGQALFKTVGCMACHTVNGEGPGTQSDMKTKFADFDAFGPDLGKIGSKTTPTWLFHWLKNPKQYFPGGRMPNLRLSDTEASDLSAYLLTLKDEAFEKAKPPMGDAARMKAILFDKIRSKESLAVTDYVLNGGPMPGELARLPEEQRPKPVAADQIPAVLGEHMVRRYGCNGCHVIPGFADDKGIGAELTEIGSKDLAQVDFGFVEQFEEHGHFSEAALRTRHAWLEKKVSDPRAFDMGRDKAPLDRLIMPRFGFRDEDARALTTFLLSMNKEKISLQRQERLSETQAALERGRRLVKDSNCTACHVVGLAQSLEEVSKLPADRGAWLADHLLLTAGGDVDRASGAQDAKEKREKEKASERMTLLAGARSFLAQRPPLGVDAKGASRLSDLLVQVEQGRQKDPFKPAVPLTVRVSGVGEGLPGRWIADRATETSQEETGKFAPPFLMDVGARVQPEWLFQFLRDPAWEYAKRNNQPIRPKVPLRMPTFGFTDAQAGDLVRFFCAGAEASYPFAVDPPAAISAQAAKDAHMILTDAMDCRSCHVVDGASNGPPVGPDLDRLVGRLRRAWLRQYIQAPNASQPFVVMPAHFKAKADGTISDDDVVPDMMDNDPRKQFDAITEYLMAPSSARIVTEAPPKKK